jgi:thiosulfate dehydrogenase [quinone] large subunit
MRRLSRVEATSLVLLRTLVGWHFLYEGYYKLLIPGWTQSGAPLAGWSAAGYLKGASGPFGWIFRGLGQSAAAPWIDVLIPIALVLIGLSLVLGLFTQLGGWGALAMLTLFYLAAIPTEGVPKPFNEGTYLLVNKTLIEWAAVLVLVVFRTGTIAGLDTWRRRPSPQPAV